MQTDLTQRLLRPEWQVLDEGEPPPVALYGGPRWEDDLDELDRPLTGFAAALRARLAGLLGGDTRQYWLEPRAVQLQWRLMQLLRPEHRLLAGQAESPFVIGRLRGLGIQVDTPFSGMELPGVDQLLEHWQADTALVWLQAPSPLHGRGWAPEAVDALCGHLRDFSLVLVDLSLSRPRPDAGWQQLMERHANLMLLREFDAHWGLPGLQLASLQAAPAWVDVLQRLWPDNQLSRPAERAALDLLTRENQQRAERTWVEHMARARQWLQRWQGPAVEEVRLGEWPGLYLRPRRPAGLLTAIRRLRPGHRPLAGDWFRLPCEDRALCDLVDHWLEAQGRSY